MKVELAPGVHFDTTEAMDIMLPYLEEFGITGRQLARALNCKEEKTAEWIKDIWFNFFVPFKRVNDRHPKATWDYFKNNNINTLAEILLRRKCIKELYQAWYKDRPEELTRKEKKEKIHEPGKTRKGGKKNKNAPKSEPGVDEVPGYDSGFDDNDFDGS